MLQNAVLINSKALLTSLFRHFLFFEKNHRHGTIGTGTIGTIRTIGTRDRDQGARKEKLS